MNFGCNPSACYIFNGCDSDNPSRILHLAFALKSYAIDKTDADTFLESLLTGERTGEVRIIRSITGEKPRPETQEGAGFGKTAVKVLSSVHTINFDDEHALENINFYNTFKFDSKNWDLYYMTDGLIHDASGERISFYGDPVLQNGPTDLIFGQATIKWTSKVSPVPFDEAFDTDEIENGLFYLISAATNPSGQYTITENEDTSVDTLSASLSYYIPFDGCELVWSILSNSDPLLAVATIDVSSGALGLAGQGNGAGVVDVIVKVEDTCGGCIQGTFAVTVTVTAA